MPTFHSTNCPRVLAELSNGQIVQCMTALQANGDYREWYEPAPCEWMYGWTESEQDIDQETITALYPEEFETDEEIPENATISTIIEVLDEVDWEVQEGWEEDYAPDYDAMAKEQRYAA